MSGETKIIIGIVVGFALLLGVATCSIQQADADQKAVCHASLSGVTASDSLRIIRVQPRCIP